MPFILAKTVTYVSSLPVTYLTSLYTMGARCGRMFRIRIGFRRIRNVVLRRAGNARPYSIHGTLLDKYQFEVFLT